MVNVHATSIRELLAAHRWDDLRQALIDMPPADIADLLFDVGMNERMMMFRLLPRDVSSDVFAWLESDQQNTLLDELTQEETRQLLSGLSMDDRVRLLDELPGTVTQRLLNLLSPEDLAQTREFLGYPEESIGRLMTPDYVAVRPDWTVARSLSHVRAKGRRSETIDTLYVVDDRWQLLDALDLKRFIFAEPDDKVADLMDSQFIALEATQDREEAVRTMDRYDLAALPVVDKAGVLVGIVTFDDVFDISRAEVTEDFHKTAAVAPLKGNYGDARFTEIYQKRIGWLAALVFANVFSGAAIASYEEMIAANVVLIFFMPLLIASSGNAGSQAATLMIRALAVGEVKLGDWWRLLRKEVLISLALGVTLAVVTVPIGVLRADVDTAVVVALTMSLVVVVGSVIGTLLPFILSRFNLDPATASGPLITSLADISGVVIYFSIATRLLGPAS